MLTQAQLQQIEAIVERETKNPESICHDFSHLIHTAIGAVWFVRMMNGSEHEQMLAWIAGLLHDIVGPTTKKIDRTIPSAERAEKILTKLNFSEEDISEIVRAIGSHGYSKEQKWQHVTNQLQISTLEDA